MSTDRQQNLIIDPEQVDQQFKKEEDLKNKLNILQKPVFKNFTIKKSKSVIHPSSRSDQPKMFVQKSQQGFRMFDQVNFQTAANITNVRFGLSLQSKSVPIKVVQSARTLPRFSPLKTKLVLKKQISSIQQRLLQLNADGEKSKKRKITQRIKVMQKRNSQTILRKNSLFLINCLKTRYKQTHKKAHIGEKEGVANMRLGRFNEKVGSVTHYQQRFQYMQEAKQRLLMAKIFHGEAKISRMSQILPQPW